jgi:ribonucleoside-diphosphate reductase alpha chain
MKKAAEKGAIPGLSKNAVTVLEKRYLKRDTTGKALETPADMFRRVATSIAQGDAAFDKKADIAALSDKFYQVMTNFEFLPNSPTLMNGASWGSSPPASSSRWATRWRRSSNRSSTPR